MVGMAVGFLQVQWAEEWLAARTSGLHELGKARAAQSAAMEALKKTKEAAMDAVPSSVTQMAKRRRGGTRKPIFASATRAPVLARAKASLGLDDAPRGEPDTR